MNKINLLCIFITSCFLFTCSNNNDIINPDGDTEHEFELHSNNRVSSLLMTKREYKSWIDNDDFSNAEKRHSLLRDIYKKFPDKYDFIFLILNENEKPSNINYYGKLIGVSNNIEGIGINIYDNSADYGSSGKLKSVMHLPGLNFLKNGPSLHEIAHNWANFALETHNVDGSGTGLTSYPYWGHWGFTGGSNRGQLGGFDQSSLIENGGGSYTVDPFGPFANGGNGVPYTEFELYLMGMLPISSVSNFDMFTDITSFSKSHEHINGTVSSSYTFSASKTSYSPSSIEDLLGKRNPSYEDSQKEFKLLIVVLTDKSLSEDEWTTVDNTAEWFSRKGDDGTYLYNFWEATGGVGTISIEN